jgi:hypothetical protein
MGHSSNLVYERDSSNDWQEAIDKALAIAVKRMGQGSADPIELWVWDDETDETIYRVRVDAYGNLRDDGGRIEKR